MNETTSTIDTTEAWAKYWADINGENWLTAKALIQLSPALHREATSWVAGSSRDLHDWVADVDENGRGWSSTEARLFRVVAALLDPYPADQDERTGDRLPLQPYTVENGDSDGRRRMIPLELLSLMGSWETDVWRILADWGTGGNNREYPGRAQVVAR